MTPDPWLRLVDDRWLPAADTPLTVAHEAMAEAYIAELERLESFPIDDDEEESPR